MPVTAIVGAQWGDEGKGRMVDYLARDADVVVRFQGGDNAGHTVVNEFGRFALHLLPSGIFNPATRCVVGAGTVVNPQGLLDEMALVEAAGVTTHNLWLSDRAHVVLAEHQALDGAAEDAPGADKIGTTRRGIGPTYADKAARIGLRLGDLKRPEWLRERLEKSYPTRVARMARFGLEQTPIDTLHAQLVAFGERLGPKIVDTQPLFREALAAGDRVLLEGQLGAMRDIDWGVYPYVTSSNPIASGAFAGAGIPPGSIDRVLGIVKAYCTAVGEGPFPTELHDAVGARLRKEGDEFGATTGRPRRCGWFDAVCARQAAWLNGMTGLALTKLDVLDAFDEIKLATGYTLDGEPIDYVPDTPDLARVVPVYETWPGWGTSTREARTWSALPKAAQALVERIAELSGVPVHYVSVGPARGQLIELEGAA